MYILKFANTNASAVFSRQCEERNLVNMDTVVFKFTFFTKTVIVYLCFMHKYMLVRKDMEVHEYKIFSNIALRRKLN